MFTKFVYEDLDQTEQQEVERAFAEARQAQKAGKLISQAQTKERAAELLARYEFYKKQCMA